MRLIDADHLRRWIIKRGLEYQLHPADILDQIDREPTIEPERKTGKWINGKCDQCGCHAPYWSMSTTYHKSNYCPECGVKMEEGGQDG